MSKRIKVAKINSDQLNKLTQAGYEVELVTVTQPKPVSPKYKYERTIRPEKPSKKDEVKGSMPDACHHNHAQDE